MPSIIILDPFTSSVFDVPQEMKWMYLNRLMILAPVREVTLCLYSPLPVLPKLVSSSGFLKTAFFHKVWRCSREVWIPSLENHSHHAEWELFLKRDLWVGKRSHVWVLEKNQFCEEFCYLNWLHFTCVLHSEHLHSVLSTRGRASAEFHVVLTQQPAHSQASSGEWSLRSVFHLCANTSKTQKIPLLIYETLQSHGNGQVFIYNQGLISLNRSSSANCKPVAKLRFSMKTVTWERASHSEL